MFKVGDKVVCIEDVNWKVGFGAKKDDIVNVSIIDAISGYLSFDEYAFFYDDAYFRKLDYDFVSEVIEMIEEDSLVLINK